MDEVVPVTTITKETILNNGDCKEFITKSTLRIKTLGGKSLHFNPVFLAIDKTENQIGKKPLNITKTGINPGEFKLKNGTYPVDGTVIFCNCDLDEGYTIHDIDSIQLLPF